MSTIKNVGYTTTLEVEGVFFEVKFSVFRQISSKRIGWYMEVRKVGTDVHYAYYNFIGIKVFNLCSPTFKPVQLFNISVRDMKQVIFGNPNIKIK